VSLQTSSGADDPYGSKSRAAHQDTDSDPYGSENRRLIDRYAIGNAL